MIFQLFKRLDSFAAIVPAALQAVMRDVTHRCFATKSHEKSSLQAKSIEYLVHLFSRKIYYLLTDLPGRASIG
jgi:hypothetical protein